MKEVPIDVPTEATRAQVQELLGNLLDKKPTTINVQMKLHNDGYLMPYSPDASLIVRRVNIDTMPQLTDYDKKVLRWKLDNPKRRVLPKALHYEKWELEKQERKIARLKERGNMPLIIRPKRKR